MQIKEKKKNKLKKDKKNLQNMLKKNQLQSNNKMKGKQMKKVAIIMSVQNPMMKSLLQAAAKKTVPV